MQIQEHRRADGAVWVAAVGSSLIAIPAVLSTLGLVAVLLLGASGSESMSLRAVVGSAAGFVLVIGPAVFGGYLLEGYWRVALGRASKGSSFWFSSAAFNAFGAGAMAVALVVELVEGNAGISLLVSCPILCWTSFMVWLGVSRGQAARLAKNLQGALQADSPL